MDDTVGAQFSDKGRPLPTTSFDLGCRVRIQEQLSLQEVAT